MSNLMELGGNIRCHRQMKGLTQRVLAERLHVSTQAISSWENGGTYPDLENLCRLAEILSVSVDKLLLQSKRDEVHMIAVDGGSTKAEFVLFSSSGLVKKVLRLPGTNASVKGVPEVLSILRRGIDLCLEIVPPVAYIFVGTGGSLLDDLKKGLSEIYTDIQIHVTTDGINALLCADEVDAAMIVGTGSILLRPSEDGYRFVGGWGYGLGDPGSAYNFGREACRLARAYRDGIDKDPLVYMLVKEWVGVENIHTLGRMPPTKIAALAPVIFEADRQGDPRAAHVIETQMQDLAQQVNAICPEGGRIVAVGGVIENCGQRLLPLLRELTGYRVEFVVPQLPPVYGACRGCMRHFRIPEGDNFEALFTEQYGAARVQPYAP